MPTFVHLPSGNWRAVIRRKGRYVAETFRRKLDAEAILAIRWALDMERRTDLGQDVSASRPASLDTLADLIDLHISDMHEVRKPLRRSKAACLRHLRHRLGSIPIAKLTREVLVEYGRARGREGVAPPRPSSTRSSAYHETNERQLISMGRLVRFAVASAMRQSEITSIRWPGIDEIRRIVIVRDRKPAHHRCAGPLAFDQWFCPAPTPPAARARRGSPCPSRSCRRCACWAA